MAWQEITSVINTTNVAGITKPPMWPGLTSSHVLLLHMIFTMNLRN